MAKTSHDLAQCRRLNEKPPGELVYTEREKYTLLKHVDGLLHEIPRTNMLDTAKLPVRGDAVAPKWRKYHRWVIMKDNFNKLRIRDNRQLARKYV